MVAERVYIQVGVFGGLRVKDRVQMGEEKYTKWPNDNAERAGRQFA